MAARRAGRSPTTDEYAAVLRALRVYLAATDPSGVVEPDRAVAAFIAVHGLVADMGDRHGTEQGVEMPGWPAPAIRALGALAAALISFETTQWTLSDDEHEKLMLLSVVMAHWAMWARGNEAPRFNEVPAKPARPPKPSGKPIRTHGPVKLYKNQVATVFGVAKKLTKERAEVIDAILKAGDRGITDRALRKVRPGYLEMLDSLCQDPDWAAVLDYRNGPHGGEIRIIEPED